MLGFRDETLLFIIIGIAYKVKSLLHIFSNTLYLMERSASHLGLIRLNITNIAS